ncbi:MAG: hypothetical protein GY696_20330 [Gammaproteobacteria bacterium]|nr:hypothetical protein [Gammaproteobacteria bacterium]
MPRMKYAVGAWANCEWGSGQYTVQVVKVDRRKAVRERYKIHYRGFNSRWDEWVPETWLSDPGTVHEHEILLTTGHKRTAASGSSPAAKSKLPFLLSQTASGKIFPWITKVIVFEKLGRMLTGFLW